MAHLDACDDGNTIGGDGCSSTCTIEAGYSCTGSICVVTYGPSIQSYTVSRDDTQIKLFLNDSILFSYAYDSSSSISYYIQGSQSSYGVTISFNNDVATNQKTATNTLSFTITFNDDIQLYGDEYFVVNFN